MKRIDAHLSYYLIVWRYSDVTMPHDFVVKNMQYIYRYKVIEMDRIRISRLNSLHSAKMQLTCAQ